VGDMMLIHGLVVVLVLALALWLVSLPKNVPAYTRVGFYLALVVVALIVMFMLMPA
jgi:hypothetical protein